MKSYLIWLAIFALNSTICYWFVYGGGARFFEGWDALNWSEDQIRFYAMGLWVIQLIAFIIGLFYEPLRTFYTDGHGSFRML